jgi:hypothetical protein
MALATTVNRFTGGTEIRHFVMAITSCGARVDRLAARAPYQGEAHDGALALALLRPFNTNSQQVPIPNCAIPNQDLRESGRILTTKTRTQKCRRKLSL